MGYLAVVLVCANPLLLTTADANYVNLLTAIRRNREGPPYPSPYARAVAFAAVLSGGAQLHRIAELTRTIP